VIRTILVFGDSLAWGRIPGKTERYALKQRWPNLLARQLGDESFDVVDDAVPGRTTVFDEPYRPHRNGIAALDLALIRSAPLDLVIIALGTNDLQERLAAPPEEIALGFHALIQRIRYFPFDPEQTPPEIMLIVPPRPDPQGELLRLRFASAYTRWPRLAAAMQSVAKATGCALFDASKVVTVDPCDGLHLSVAGNEMLASALANEVHRALPQTRLLPLA
jgi:lysophospholipase L1-like esterase